MGEGVLGYIEPERLQSWTDGHQILDQESLRATDIENPVTGFQVGVRDDILGNGNPPAIILVAAVPLFARTIKIFPARTPGQSR